MFPRSLVDNDSVPQWAIAPKRLEPNRLMIGLFRFLSNASRIVRPIADREMGYHS